MKLETNLAVSLEDFQNRINVHFNDLRYLVEAITHISYLNENPNFKERYDLVDGHNERMEYVGDSTLDHAIAEKIYLNYPGREGDLTIIKTHYAEGNKLAKVAEKIGLDKILLVGNGEANNELGRKARNENAMEALICAIEQDQGYKKAKEFINKFILCNLDNDLEDIDKMKKIDNPIGYLQNQCVKKGYGNPNFEQTSVIGPDHSPQYSFIVRIDDEKWAEGTGNSKPAARKDAAMNALTIFAIELDSF